jgi:monothiol glutaredoxin
VDGELVGGCDIVMEMFESGELADLLGVEQPQAEAEAEPEQPVQQRPIGLENRLN